MPTRAVSGSAVPRDQLGFGTVVYFLSGGARPEGTAWRHLLEAIIYGETTKEVRIAESHEAVCPHCCTTRRFSLWLVYTYVHIFFVLGYITDRDYWVTCDACNRGELAPAPKVDAHDNTHIPFAHRNGMKMVFAPLLVCVLYPTILGVTSILSGGPSTAGSIVGSWSYADDGSSVNAVLFRDSEGRILTQSELEMATGLVNWAVPGSSDVSAVATDLHEQGRAAGAAGEYQESLTLLERAHRAAPEWAYPVYDMAYTYVLMGKFSEAEAHYAKVDSMCPRGFFTAKAALDTLRRERTHEFAPGTYREFVLLEGEPDLAKKRSALRTMVAKQPQLAVAWKTLASLEESDKDVESAIDAGLSSSPDDDTKGMLLVNKALLRYRQGQRRHAAVLLGGLALDSRSTLSTQELAKFALADVLRGAGP